jgi:small subunit ribosomal protein S9
MADLEAKNEAKTAEVEEVKKASKNDKSAFWSVGRRKESIARIKMSLGKGEITINDQPIEEFAPTTLQKAKILAPLAATDRQDSFDISVKVHGGGTVARLDAIALGIARALVQYEEGMRPTLRQQGLLTRDARMKERKKYGLKRARKAPQFSKR